MKPEADSIVLAMPTETPTTRSIIALVLASLLGGCASPDRGQALRVPPSQRAQTSQIDDYFTFKRTETGLRVEGWANYGG